MWQIRTREEACISCQNRYNFFWYSYWKSTKEWKIPLNFDDTHFYLNNQFCTIRDNWQVFLFVTTKLHHLKPKRLKHKIIAYLDTSWINVFITITWMWNDNTGSLYKNNVNLSISNSCFQHNFMSILPFSFITLHNYVPLLLFIFPILIVKLYLLYNYNNFQRLVDKT